MSGMNFNALLAEADKSGGGEPVPPGEYDVVAEQVQAVQTQKGKQNFKTRFKVLTGPHAGRIVFNNFIISPESAGALSFFFQHMSIFGLNRDYFATNPSPEQVAADIQGKQAKITVEHREWNGKAQADVKTIKAPTAGIVAPAAPAAGMPTAAPAAAPAAPVAAPAPAPAPAPTVPGPGF